MKRRMPTQAQWERLRLLMSEGWEAMRTLYDDGAPEDDDYHKTEQAVRAFEGWMEERYRIRFRCPLVPREAKKR